jgi:hypothetical protein
LDRSNPGVGGHSSHQLSCLRPIGGTRVDQLVVDHADWRSRCSWLLAPTVLCAVAPDRPPRPSLEVRPGQNSMWSTYWANARNLDSLAWVLAPTGRVGRPFRPPFVSNTSAQPNISLAGSQSGQFSGHCLRAAGSQRRHEDIPSVHQAEAGRNASGITAAKKPPSVGL